MCKGAGMATRARAGVARPGGRNIVVRAAAAGGRGGGCRPAAVGPDLPSRRRAALDACEARVRPRLRASTAQDVIVEVFDAAWAAAAHPGPSAAELAAARARLAPDGVWIGVLHLDLLADGQAAAFAGAAAATFAHTQAWLPPRGADSLILVGTSAPLPLSRLEQRFAAQPAPLRALGFPTFLLYTSPLPLHRPRSLLPPSA